MTTQLIPVSSLAKSPNNARRTISREGIEEIKASILAHGLIHNLVVTPAGEQFHVVAGSRRLEALQSLIAEEKLPADHAVLCQVVEEEHALELSIAENAIRHAMHPADEFEAFRDLIELGQDDEAVAQRFGVEAKHVQKRLKLAKVAPELLAEYRAGELTLDALTAFTVTDDHEKQLAVYKSLGRWYRDDASHIRRCLTESAIPGTNKLAVFVGQEAYEAAGGKVRADLFSEVSYFEDAELLTRLAGDKLEAAANELVAEGWGWLEIAVDEDWRFTHSCSCIHPTASNAPAELLEQKERLEAEFSEVDERIYEADEDMPEEEAIALDQRRDAIHDELEELEGKLESYATFDPEEMKSAGCYIYLDHRGVLEIEKGLVRKADQKREKGKAAKEKKLPAKLLADLAGYRLQAAQAELAMHPDLAFDLLVFKVAVAELNWRGPDNGPDVSFRRKCHSGPGSRETFAALRLEGIKEGLPVEWLEQEAEAERFASFRQLSREDKHRILAYCTAVTLQPQLAPAEGEEPTAYDETLALTGANVAEYWRPTAENYLSRITKDQLLEIGRACFTKKWADDRGNFKKGQLVEQLHNAFADPDKHGGSPEIVQRLKTWLPEGMTFGAAEAKPEPAKKAAKKKKAA